MGSLLGSLRRAVFPPRPGAYVWTVAPYRSSDPFLKVGVSPDPGSARTAIEDVMRRHEERSLFGVLQGPGVNERCLRNMSGGCTWLTCPAPSLSGAARRGRHAGV